MSRTVVTPSPRLGETPRGDANSIDTRAEDTTRRARRPERAVIRLRAWRAVFSRIRKFGLNTLGWSDHQLVGRERRFRRVWGRSL